MLQILPITPAQVKAINASENFLNESRQILYSLYRGKGITDPHRLAFNLINKIDLRRGGKTCCIIKSWHLLYMLEHGIINLNYQMNRIFMRLIKHQIILSIL